MTHTEYPKPLAYRLSPVALLAITLILLTAPAHAQDAGYSIHRDLIRGRITVDSGKPVASAAVTITMAPDRSFLRALTDSSGAYVIVFERGTGDYLVHVAASGMTTVRKRVQRSGSDSILVVDIPLVRSAPPQLATVRVRAAKPKPRRGPDFGNQPGPGAAENVVGGVAGSVAPELAGNLAALSGTMPGVVLTPTGVSASGLSPMQNGATLNGLGFAGSELPRDAITQVRVSSSTYDPARGWFGGLQQQVQLVSDVVGSMRSAHLTLDAPALQYTDPVSRALGSRFTAGQLGVGGADRFHRDALEYNYGVSARRRTDAPASVLTAPASVLEATGVDADSIAHLREILNGIGLPGAAAGQEFAESTDHVTFVGQLGKAPSNWATFQPARSTWTVLAFGDFTQRRAFGLRPDATSASRTTSSNGQAGLQLHLTRFVRDNVLMEGHTGLSFERDLTRPDVLLPAATVILLSQADGGSSMVVPVSVAGAPLPRTNTRRWTWETAADLKAYPSSHPTHRLKLSADARIDGARDETAGTLGTFSFNSLSDLAAGHASAFTRILTAPVQAARNANAFVALGDWWRASESFELLYGVRLEATRFLDAPANNPSLEEFFGYATNHVPNSIGLSPRLGFTWHLRSGNPSAYSGPLGRLSSLPAGTFRGGIGDFRTFLPATLAEHARIATGLPDDESTLACVGAAVPTVDWAAFAADNTTIPSDCAAGALPAFAQAAPDVELFDPSYRTPHSWRANVGYTSRLPHVNYSIDASYSLNLDQPGRIDLNFENSAAFTTATEARPVYASQAEIVGSTGLIAPAATRRVGNYGHVFDNVSSNRSVSRQLTITMSPDLDAVSRWIATGSYTLASVRSRLSGFDGSTFGSPTAREWGRGDFDVRHQFLLQGGLRVHHVAFTAFAHIQSGLPFTPLVGSDVNGDGLVNDRAFIFNPATTSDSAVARGLQSLLSGASKSTARCLERQLGRPAERNSCDAAWTTMLNAQIAYQGSLPFVRRSGSVSLFFNNPLAGLDQLLHGPDQLHGWGTFAVPDPVLYTVRGFDPVAGKFQYEVNSRFGDARSAAATIRAPFRVTLDVSVNLSADSYAQFLHRWVRPGRDGYAGPRLPASMIKRAYEHVVADPYQAILEESDSLLLSRVQVDSLHSAERTYLTQRDSVLSDLASFLAGLGDTYDEAVALRRQREALDQAIEIGHISVRRVLPTILDRIQLRMLPFPADRLFAAPEGVHGMDVMQAP